MSSRCCIEPRGRLPLLDKLTTYAGTTAAFLAKRGHSHLHAHDDARRAHAFGLWPPESSTLAGIVTGRAVSKRQARPRRSLHAVGAYRALAPARRFRDYARGAHRKRHHRAA